jgi:hypothetical protein
MVTVRLTKRLQCRFARQALKLRGGVDQASIKKHPTFSRAGRGSVGQSHRNGAACEGGLVDPRERGAAAFQFVLDDPPATLLHNGVAPPAKLGEQRGFAATRAPGDYDETIHLKAPSESPCRQNNPHQSEAGASDRFFFFDRLHTTPG